MGRHSAPAPADQRVPTTASTPLPVITAAMLRPAVAAPAPRLRPPVPASGQRQPYDVLPVPAAITRSRTALPHETRPVRTAELPPTEPVRLVAPDIAAHSLLTGPVTTRPPRAPRRGARAARYAVALTAIAIAGAVAMQLTTQRSDADAVDDLLPAATAVPSTPVAPATGTHSAVSTSASASASASTSGSSSAASTHARSSSSPSRASAASTASRSARSTTPSNARSLRTALTGGRDLAAGLFRFSDFGSDLLGMDLTGRLTGAGSDSTTIEMTPGSSTKRAEVPTTDWKTNQLSLIRVQNASVISGFTLRGTDQGHLYNGLRISRSTDPTISDVKVISIPGDDDIPPGETFGINDYRTSGATYSHVEVDGSGISGATFGTNNSNDVSISNSSFHDAGHSNGATFWQTKNVTVKYTTSVDNYDAAFNFERVSGTVLLDHVTMHGNRLSDLRINSDKASAVYRIVDPVLDGKKLTIVMTPKYMGHKNVQKKSDVHVIVNGVDRTDELVKWVDHF